MAQLDANVGGTIDYQTATMDIAILSKAVKPLGTANYGGC